MDIDPRAAQIASLALWLRAQRAFKELGLERVRRARVRRTNIVVAEPLPGDVAVAEAFFETLESPLDDVARELFAMMELAGDAGTLLRIEDDLATLVEEHLEREVSLWDEEGATGWTDAEASLLDALRRYAERPGTEAYARRLFSEDTARGLAFIDLSRTKFDVVLMNPPFGASSVKAKDYIKDTWPRTKNDLYAAFVERGLTLLVPRGQARRHHLAHGVLPDVVPEVAGGDPAEGSRAHRRGRSGLRGAGRHGRDGGVLPGGASMTTFLRLLETDPERERTEARGSCCQLAFGFRTGRDLRSRPVELRTGAGSHRSPIG